MLINVSKEYSEILKQYMRKFRLVAVDIAFLIKSNKDVIEGLLESEKGVVLKTLETIAQIFGLRYFQFGNPDFPMPEYDSLPQKTKDRIIFRKEQGISIPTTYNNLDLTNKIIKTLSNYSQGDEFLASELGEKINTTFEFNLVDFKQITGRLNNELSEFLVKTGKTLKTEGKRGRPEEYYRLIKEITPEMLKKAKGKIGETN